MARSFTKANSIADFVTAIYSKDLNFTKTDSVTDPATAFYNIGLKLYKNKLWRNLQLKTDCHTLHH